VDVEAQRKDRHLYKDVKTSTLFHEVSDSMKGA